MQRGVYSSEAFRLSVGPSRIDVPPAAYSWAIGADNLRSILFSEQRKSTRCRSVICQDDVSIGLVESS